MKTTICLLAVLGCGGLAWAAGELTPPGGFTAPAVAPEAPSRPVGGELRPGERAEAPSADAAETLGIYADALAAEDWSKALFLVDLPPLRQALLDRRLAELRAGNPALTAKDLEEVSATLQTRELAPSRLKGILAGLWQHEGYAGMSWTAEGWSRAGDGAWLARVGFQDKEGAHREMLVGLREGEDGWVIAPDLLERMAAVRPVRIPAEVPLPDDVAALTEAYWQARKAGNHGEAWALMGTRFRETQPPEEYAKRSVGIEMETGTPVAWKLLHCRQLGPGVLGLGYALTTTRGEFQTVMVAVKEGERWTLADVQWRKAEGGGETGAGAGGAEGAGGARPFSTDLKAGGLKTDLKTPL